MRKPIRGVPADSISVDEPVNFMSQHEYDAMSDSLARDPEWSGRADEPVDPLKTKPYADYLLVRVDPFREEKNGIILTGNRETEHVRTGTIVAVGPGRRTDTGVRVPVDAQVGERVAFLRWHQEHTQGKKLTHLLGQDHMLLRECDILCCYPADQLLEFN